MRCREALAAATLVLVLGSGCRATLQGGRVAPPLPPQPPVPKEASTSASPKPVQENGLIYYLTRPAFTIDVKDRHGDKDAEPTYDLKVSTVADSDRRFSVRFQGGTITKDVVDFKLRPDGTLASFGAKSESQIPQLVASLGNLAASVISTRIPGFAAKSEGPTFLDQALNNALCEGPRTPAAIQEYSNAKCAAGQLAPEMLLLPKESCKGQSARTCDTGAPFDVPPADAGIERGDRLLLMTVFNSVNRFFTFTETKLETQLGKKIDAEPLIGIAQQLKALSDFEASLAAKLGVEPRHPADQVLSHLAEVLKADIGNRFAKGDFASRESAKKAEPFALADYRLLVAVEKLIQSIKSPPTPRERVAKLLAAKKLAAEELFARSLADPGAVQAFKDALADYSASVERLLDLDDRLEPTQLRDRRQALETFLVRPLAADADNHYSKAYVDYRGELDLVLGQIGSRLGSAVDKKKPDDPLPRGTDVTHTLDQVVSCVVGSKTQIYKEDLFTLSELWIRFGQKEAVVFRTRNSGDQRFDCGKNEPFGASVAELPSQIAPQPVRRSTQTRSGLSARHLTAANLLGDPLELDGVLVQIPVPYEIVAVLLGPAGDRVLKTATLSLPADDEFLDLGFKGRFLRTQDLSVALHDNGVISEYSLTSEQVVTAAVQNLADATKAVTGALSDVQKAKKPAADPLDTENSQLKIEILNQMLKANLEAIQKGLPPPFPNALGN